MMRLSDMANSFIAPVPQMLKDKVIKQLGPRVYEVTDPDGVRIEDSQGRLEIDLIYRAVFVSISHDYNQAWQSCHMDWAATGRNLS
jgi:hypothetical protein